MRTIVQDVPSYLTTLVETLRLKLQDPAFLARHRVRPEDFTRQRQLTFTVLMLGILQKTVKSIQRHLHELLDDLSAGELFHPVTTGAWTHARAKLKHSAFIELNRDCVLPTIYQTDRAIKNWRGHRLLGLDGSLVRLPVSAELGEAFGWVESSNQWGKTSTRYPEARLSILYDVLNRACIEARLDKSTTGEITLALEQLPSAHAGDIILTDQGYTGFPYLASVWQHGIHFIARCSRGSFGTAQDLFRRNRANQSRVVRVFAAPQQKPICEELNLPVELQVRFITLRLPNRELAVFATSLLDEAAYPTLEFANVYRCRWEHETLHLMLKSRLDLENFSGLTEEAVRQDFHASVLLCNLEMVLSEPVQQSLTAGQGAEALSVQVNRSVSFHALKEELFELLYRNTPTQEVLFKLMQMFAASPVRSKPKRKLPRPPGSLRRSLCFQRHLKKIVF